MNEMMLEGMVGEPLPYLLRSDGMITCIMFLCLAVVSFVLVKEKKYLFHQLKSLLSTRERASMFDDVVVADVRYTILLLLNTCVLLGRCVYFYLSETFPEIFAVKSHGGLLFGFIICLIVFLIVKLVSYKSINWVFFQKARNVIWLNTYFNVMIWLGLLLLPLVLLVVFFALSLQTAFYFIVAIIMFAKIALFYKCFVNFFGKIYGLVHLILYFCALEILPDLIVWKGIEILSNNLILNI